MAEVMSQEDGHEFTFCKLITLYHELLKNIKYYNTWKKEGIGHGNLSLEFFEEYGASKVHRYSYRSIFMCIHSAVHNVQIILFMFFMWLTLFILFIILFISLPPLSE